MPRFMTKILFFSELRVSCSLRNILQRNKLQVRIKKMQNPHFSGKREQVNNDDTTIVMYFT